MKATIVITIGIITSIIGTIILLTTKDVADYEKEGEIRKMTANAVNAVNLSNDDNANSLFTKEWIKNLNNLREESRQLRNKEGNNKFYAYYKKYDDREDVYRYRMGQVVNATGFGSDYGLASVKDHI